MGPKKNKIKEESKKKSKEPKNVWRWRDVELDAYADVLADPEISLAATLDKLALQKSSNNEVFWAYIERVSSRDRNWEFPVAKY